MAFKLYSTDDGHVPAWEYYECSAMTPLCGMAMALDSNGQLVASAQPKYICMRQEETAVEAGTKIPVVRITPDQIWENILFSDASAAKVGGFADVDSTGKWVDAKDPENNTMEIVYLTGTTLTDHVRVRFVK